MAWVVVEGEPDLGLVYPWDDPYVLWYNQITRRYVSRNGAATDGAIRCFEFLGVQPLTPQQCGELGRIGLQHLARLRTHVHKNPPVHRQYVRPTQPVHADEVVNEVEEMLEQGVHVPHEDQQDQQDVPHDMEEQEEVPHDVRRNEEHVDHPIYTPDFCISPSLFSCDMYRSSTDNTTTDVDWQNLDVNVMGDPSNTFGGTSLQINKRRVEQSTTLGTEGVGEITQVEIGLEAEAEAKGEGDDDMELDDDEEDDVNEGDDHNVGPGDVTQDGTPPLRRSKHHPHPPRTCGPDGLHDKCKGKGKQGRKKRKVKGD